jgi:hypothetical protein
MEIFFDQLMDGGDKALFEQTGADVQAQEKWQSFLSNMKQVKADNNVADNDQP